MNKIAIVNHLRTAKTAHIKWLQKAKLLINGLPIKEDAIPIDSTECKFGQWFYTEGQRLHNMPNNALECMTRIEELHFAMHDIYLKIFKIFFTQPQTGIFAKIFGSSNKKISEEDLSRGREYFLEMEEVSKGLLDELNRLERRLLAIPEDELNELLKI